MTERESLFRRLSAACGGHGAAAGEPLSGGAPIAPESDSVALFAKTFTAAGGFLLRGPVERALSDLGEILRAEGVTALFYPEDDAAAREIAEALVPFGPFNLTMGAEVRGGSTAVTAGFRSAEAAIAETGTIVETSAGGKTLLPGLIADVHVSIVPVASVVARMEEALAAFTADPPRNISFLSGPSKTGDIEQTLTVGAHGPKKAIALLQWEDTPSLRPGPEPGMSPPVRYVP
ncbi:MAG: LUD domain-containing protein [Deltaproteobacteria bacterium]|nr:LUD domain-containing protein [Deltaproteobacteria bacterium]